MAGAGYAISLLGGLPDDIKRAFRALLDYVLTNLRIGRTNVGKRAENMQWYFYQGTTPAIADEEFSIAHGLGRAPFLLIPIVPLDQVGNTLIRLAVPRVADSSRVYLTSPDTDAPFTILIEG